MHLNDRARAIAEHLMAEAGQLGVEVQRSADGVRIVDCGVKKPGGNEAGILLARAAMADLGAVELVPAGSPLPPHAAAWGQACPWTLVSVASETPVAACLAAQYAGWKVQEGKYFAMASGPLRAAIGREELFNEIGLRERPANAVGLLEAGKLPPDSVCRQLALDAGVAPEDLILLVARTASPAGTLQVIARSLETALHKLHDLHFDLRRICRGAGAAPLAPVPADDLTAIGHTNDAILYGGSVTLEVTGDDASLAAIGEKMVSSASSSYGEPFCQLFAKAGHDFYALDPALFAPARVELHNLDTGTRHIFGQLAPALVQTSFGVPTTPAGA